MYIVTEQACSSPRLSKEPRDCVSARQLLQYGNLNNASTTLYFVYCLTWKTTGQRHVSKPGCIVRKDADHIRGGWWRRPATYTAHSLLCPNNLTFNKSSDLDRFGRQNCPSPFQMFRCLTSLSEELGPSCSSCTNLQPCAANSCHTVTQLGTQHPLCRHPGLLVLLGT